MENEIAVCVGRYVASKLLLELRRYHRSVSPSGPYWTLGEFDISFHVVGTEVEWFVSSGYDSNCRSWDLADPGFDLDEIVTWVAGVRGLVSSLKMISS